MIVSIYMMCNVMSMLVILYIMHLFGGCVFVCLSCDIGCVSVFSVWLSVFCLFCCRCVSVVLFG